MVSFLRLTVLAIAIAFGDFFCSSVTERQAFVNFVNKLNFSEYVRDADEFIVSNRVVNFNFAFC